MSSNSIIFSIVKSSAKNKNIEVDENGYYKVTLGAINSFNTSGDFYLEDGVKNLIENSSSSLHKKLKKGYLLGEMGHPKFKPGMTRASYIDRSLNIDMSMVSHHIRDIIFTPTNEPSGMPGAGNVIKIEGWIKPSGPHGELLKAALDNPDQNVAFSLRGFTEDKLTGTKLIKKILNIVTWDWVPLPGIEKANKWDTLSLESSDLYKLDIDKYIKDGKFNKKKALGMGLENSDSMDIVNELCNSINTNSNNCNNRLLTW